MTTTTRKTQSGKVLLGIFAISAVVCCFGCWQDNAHPSNRGWTGEIAHVEVHGHRPLDEAIKEQARDEARRDMTQEECDYHDAYDSAREQEQNTDFGSMT